MKKYSFQFIITNFLKREIKNNAILVEEKIYLYLQ